MSMRLDDRILDQLFRTARTRNGWTDKPVSDNDIRELYDLLQLGPTSANSCPGRFVWVRSADGKAKLAALASDNNKAKVLAAPVTAIIGYDLNFPAFFPKLFPARAELMQQIFGSNETLAQDTAFRNGSLQGAYLIIAARALGLDCGPMSGFDNVGVDKQFFAGTRIKSNFICSIGYGSDENLFPRNPRPSFEDTSLFA
jgi:3-hydroxypropanoate dehydrogenase